VNQQNRNLFIALGVLVVFLLLGPMLVGGMMGPGFTGPGMMGWGYPGGATSGNGWLWGLGMGLGGLMMLAFWGVLIGGIVLFVRWIAGQRASGTTPSATEDPMTILRRRYAAGEIDQQTFERMRSDLEGVSSPPRHAVVADGRTESTR